MDDQIYYAIGDIHGEADRLRDLHAHITAHHDQFYAGQPQTRIHLGDYIDRGPDSCAVIDQIIRMTDQSPFKIINLKGNHESLMLDACQKKHPASYQNWLDNGGEATLASYETHGHDHPPKHHIDWMQTLPAIYRDQARGLVFVHAGIDPDDFPGDREAVYLWTRSAVFFNTSLWLDNTLDNIQVFHGHTPTLTNTPDVSEDGRRINIDTGACYGGALTAAIITPNEPLRFLHA